MADATLHQDLLDLMQKMWGPVMCPFPGLPIPTASVQELDKKIAELKAVETWLTMNVGLVQMSIKTLEMQKSALEAITGGTKQSSGPKK